jgi:hypothetical protein
MARPMRDASYEIRIRGRISPALLDSFEGMSSELEPVETVLQRPGSRPFRLGDALVAGKFSSHPALLRFGARVAQEGGADVPATWAAARAT